MKNEIKAEIINLQELHENIDLLLNKKEFWDNRTQYSRMRAYSWTNNHFFHQIETPSKSLLKKLEEFKQSRQKILNVVDHKIINDEVKDIITSFNSIEEKVEERLKDCKEYIKTISKELDKNKRNTYEYESFYNTVKDSSINLLKEIDAAIKLNIELNDLTISIHDKVIQFEDKNIMDFLKDKIEQKTQKISKVFKMK